MKTRETKSHPAETKSHPAGAHLNKDVLIFIGCAPKTSCTIGGERPQEATAFRQAANLPSPFPTSYLQVLLDVQTSVQL
jgi:hypothetical protein